MHLSLERGFLRAAPKDGKPVRVPLDDIAVVIGNAHGLSYSGNLLNALAERGVLVVLCNKSHQPVSWLWPLEGHHEQTGRMAVQIEATPGLKSKLWQQLIRAKIINQGAVASARGAENKPFEAMAKRVKPGDPGNIEAQAAQRYFPILFGPGFARSRERGGPNALLNWGYTVLRSAVARAVMAAGLHPSIGLFHKNTQNPMILIDDLMEPFRPFIDLAALRLTLAGKEEVDRETKHRLVSVMYVDVTCEGETKPLMTAIDTLALSLARSFQARKPSLILPQPPTPLELGPVGHETC